MVDFKEDERLNTLNHSCAHVMAQAVKHLISERQVARVGPVVKEDFIMISILAIPQSMMM